MFSYEHKVCKDNKRLMSVKRGKLMKTVTRERRQCILAKRLVSEAGVLHSSQKVKVLKGN